MGFIIYWQKYSCILDSFEIEYIPQEELNKIKDKVVTHNIFRIEDMHAGKTFLDCTNFPWMTIKRMSK